jgi:hypothetical protein
LAKDSAKKGSKLSYPNPFLAETNSTVVFRVGFIPIIVLEQEKQKFTINTLNSIRSLLYFFCAAQQGNQ